MKYAGIIGESRQIVLCDSEEIPEGWVSVSYPRPRPALILSAGLEWVEGGMSREYAHHCRRAAYRERLDPLISEMAVKQIFGADDEISALKALIIDTRKEIQDRFPCPDAHQSQELK